MGLTGRHLNPGWQRPLGIGAVAGLGRLSSLDLPPHGRRRGCGPAVVHRDHVDPVRRFLVAVEQDHPRPRPDHEPDWRPPTGQLRTSERESFQHPQRAPDSGPGIVGQIECRDRLVHVPLRSRGDDYLRHSGQLVERRPFAMSRLGQALLRPLPCAGDGIEDLRDASGIRVCIVKRGSEKRTRKSSLLHMRALGEPRELPRVFVVKGHVDALRRRCHLTTVHDSTRFVRRVKEGVECNVLYASDGASRTRTGDLVGAIHALFQLSYSPSCVPGRIVPKATQEQG
jgi:hypothetical protein